MSSKRKSTQQPLSIELKARKKETLHKQTLKEPQYNVPFIGHEDYLSLMLFNQQPYLIVEGTMCFKANNFITTFVTQYLSIVDILLLGRTCRHLNQLLQVLRRQLLKRYKTERLNPTFRISVKSFHHNVPVTEEDPFLYWIGKGNFVYAKWLVDELHVVPHFRPLFNHDVLNSCSLLRIPLMDSRLEAREIWKQIIDSAKLTSMMKLFVVPFNPQQEVAQLNCIQIYRDFSVDPKLNLITFDWSTEMPYILGLVQNMGLFVELKKRGWCSSFYDIKYFLVGLCISGNVKLLKDLATNFELKSWFPDFDKIIHDNLSLWMAYAAAFGHREIIDFLWEIEKIYFINFGNNIVGWHHLVMGAAMAGLGGHIDLVQDLVNCIDNNPEFKVDGLEVSHRCLTSVVCITGNVALFKYLSSKLKSHDILEFVIASLEMGHRQLLEMVATFTIG
jgi:hypothetical protein